MIHENIQPYMPKLVELLEKHKIKSAFFFGSVLTENFHEKSDLDILVNFQEGLNPLERGELWWNLHDSLRDNVHREIDLVSEKSLKNPYFIQEVNRTKVIIYGS
ncbi:MAG: nucleotidyltransferase family protein [Cytophagales bacterium]